MFTNEVTLQPHSPSPLGFILLPMDWTFVGARWTPCTRHEKGLKSEPHSKDSWGASEEKIEMPETRRITLTKFWDIQIAKEFLVNGNRTTALGVCISTSGRYEETTATCPCNQINPVKFFWHWFLYNYPRSEKLKFHHTTGKWHKNDWNLVTFIILYQIILNIQCILEWI